MLGKIKFKHHLQGRCPHDLLMFAWDFSKQGNLIGVDSIMRGEP